MLAKSNGGQVLDDEEWFKEAYQRAPSQWCGELGRRGNRGRTIGRYCKILARAVSRQARRQRVNVSWSKIEHVCRGDKADGSWNYNAALPRKHPTLRLRRTLCATSRVTPCGSYDVEGSRGQHHRPRLVSCCRVPTHHQAVLVHKSNPPFQLIIQAANHLSAVLQRDVTTRLWKAVPPITPPSIQAPMHSTHIHAMPPLFGSDM
jgi:hypothetical protein